MTRIADLSEVRRWFTNNGRNVAIVCGAVSGGLEVMDFDADAEAMPDFEKVVNEVAPGLMQKILCERSPHGAHIIYRCQEITTIPGSQKLAWKAIEVTGQGEHEYAGKRYKAFEIDGRWFITVCLVETKGERGYCVVAPSKGYGEVWGCLADLPIITAAEREILIETARSLNEWIPPQQVNRGYQARSEGQGGKLPGQDFDERLNIEGFRALLERHEWERAGNGRNGWERWRRPGKGRGNSASLHVDEKVFVVFSTSCYSLEAGRGYGPFAVYAILEHKGDFSAAARALAAEGYGTRAPKPTTAANEEIPTRDIISAAFDGQQGCARLFTRLYRDRFCFDHAAGLWHVWAGHHWTLEPMGEPLSALDDVGRLFDAGRAECSGEIVLVGQKLKETTDKEEQARLKQRLDTLEAQEKACAKQTKDLNSLAYRKAVVEFSAQGRGSLGIAGEEWNRLPWTSLSQWCD